MDENMKEFVAFSRKLLRELKKVRELLNKNDIDEVKKLIDELIEDTEKDIEA